MITSADDPRVLVAFMLISIGVTTAEKMKTYFSQNTDDDALLAQLHAECDSRIARLDAEAHPTSATDAAQAGS